MILVPMILFQGVDYYFYFVYMFGVMLISSIYYACLYCGE
jgi:hypothetical protein